MSAMDIVSTVNILINLGLEIQNRLDSLNQAAEELQLLTTNLQLLLDVFESPVNENIFKGNVSQFVTILDVLQSIARSCAECAKALDIDPAGATIAAKTGSRGKKFVKRLWALGRIPDLLAEIQRKAEQLQHVYTAVFAVLIQDMRVQQGRMTGKEPVESAIVQKTAVPENMLDFNLSTDFASIDRMVGSLMKECEYLQQRLREATLIPDASAVQDYQAQNPEAASFWKDRFQKDGLNASDLRYEVLYVSWARFVHAVETSFVLKKIPTGVFQAENIDLIRQQGSRYFIDQRGTRCLSTIRPLWLPALRSALDPLNKGYVKPHDYFDLLHDTSLSNTLRRLALESSGYGTIIECERSASDLSLPAAIESPRDHIGWISAQIVAVPTPKELGIVPDQEVIRSSSEALLGHFNNTAQDIHVYVRYLQTGQIERKSLLRQIRSAGGISLGAAVSVRRELESGGYAWSDDLHITEFQACYGGRYKITAGVGSSAVVFCMRPLKGSFDKMLRDDESSSDDSAVLELECMLLGPSKTFIQPPKVGEKVQIEHEGLWHDARVTIVDGDEIEYTDWDSVPKQAPTDDTKAQDDSEDNDTGSDGFFFPAEQLTQLGKGTRRLWQPWRRDLQRYDVRPYRCFHIGDSIEAPVMYPDFRYRYHLPDTSELYLPARIVDVQGDQYVVEFSPALSVHGWWPGRIPRGEEIELFPGSGVRVRNPVDLNRVSVGMDRVRPLSVGPRPVLGVQSAKPAGWSSFQGVRLGNLEELMERGLWSDGHDSQEAGGQKGESS
ncbi:uncharacterized protein C8A04DRAFT_33653 [Dichotomopilus funicola]|uniref:Uncharacterized protein n=1 Tax=Dichotomopilus funicola TaxID=1934379 RepID=A0AAN6ZS87_9PEZI|nr:hypothetical protein C8A04DRAFT_33653 [Dichotomopilus funicola]